jgi:hypothetical protein
MTETITPRRGLVFIHSRQITRDNQPMTCTVTRVTTDTVYFRNATGYGSKVARDRFADAVKRVAVVPEDDKAEGYDEERYMGSL